MNPYYKNKREGELIMPIIVISAVGGTTVLGALVVLAIKVLIAHL